VAGFSHPIQSLVLWCSGVVVSASSSLLVEVFLAKSREALLLRGCVDICSNQERDDIEEWNPGVLGQELLREGKTERGGDPADLHDRQETGLPGRMDLVDGLCAGNESHEDQVD